MRIISKHHDYYDCAANQLLDKSVTFVRKTEEILSNPFRKSMGDFCQMYSRYTVNTKDAYHLTPQLIFFCGTVYPVLVYTDYTWKRPDDYDPYSYHSNPDRYGYTSDEVMSKSPDFTHSHIKYWFSDGKLYRDFLIRKEKCGNNKEDATNKTNLKHFSPHFTMKKDAMTMYAIKNGIAYYSMEYAGDQRLENGDWVGIKIVHYPNLKAKEFFKVVPIVDAFQRIQMYLTNELAKEKMMPIKPVSDKIKAESHGFDKYSFRKDKRVTI